MPKARVKILAPAFNDIDRIADYHLLAVGPISAEKITGKLLDSIEKLGEYPLLGPEHSDSVLQNKGYRKLVCGEYICVYRLIDDTVYVYRVIHGTTDYPKLFR
ncbi:plasmid stabilization system protein [Peptococcaceae bacterium CEB3]|nr:plasmid stabilization system protein [Peptococcaceae bacterium CEB3]